MSSGPNGNRGVQHLLDILLRIQELSFAMMEHEAAESKGSMKEIQESLEMLCREVPGEWIRVMKRLQGGGQPAIVPAADGFCSFCRIQVPTQVYQEVRRGSKIHQCPCCARILYVPREGGFHLAKGSPRMGKGGIARFSSEELVVPNVSGRSREEVLEQLVSRMHRGGWIQEPERVLRAAVERENLVTTAMDYGLAFPHVRGVEGGGLVMAVGLSKRGVRFAPQGRRLTKIIFFSVIPQAASSLYLKIVAGLVAVLREKEAREKLFGCRDAGEAWKALVEITEQVLE